MPWGIHHRKLFLIHMVTPKCQLFTFLTFCKCVYIRDHLNVFSCHAIWSTKHTYLADPETVVDSLAVFFLLGEVSYLNNPRTIALVIVVRLR